MFTEMMASGGGGEGSTNLVEEGVVNIPSTNTAVSVTLENIKNIKSITIWNSNSLCYWDINTLGTNYFITLSGGSPYYKQVGVTSSTPNDPFFKTVNYTDGSFSIITYSRGVGNINYRVVGEE